MSISSVRHLSFLRLFVVLCLLATDPLSPNESTAQTSVDSLPATVEARKRASVQLIQEQARLKVAGDLVGFVRTVNQLGEVQLKLRDLGAARLSANEALSTARTLDSSARPLLIDSLVFSARVDIHHDENSRAINQLIEATTLSREIGYRRGEAESLTQLGLAHFQETALSEAESTNDAALRIWYELNDEHGIARTLVHQGETYMLQDKAAQSTDALRRAESLWRKLGNSIELASTLIDLNFLAIRQGQWQKALAFLGEAQVLVTDKEAEPYLAGQIATSFGEAFEAYGQLQSALSHFEEALRLYREHAHDKAASVDAGIKVARVKARLGDYLGASRQIEEELLLARQIEDLLREGLCHEELGKVWLATAANDAARQEFSTAIAIFKRINNLRPWARAQTLLGQTEFVLGNQSRSSDAYNKALKAFQNIDDYANEAAVCFGLGKLALSQQRLDEAGKYLQRSISLTEHLRENASSKELRSSFLASVHDRYETYAEWLMARHAIEPHKGFDVQAFEASELSRARSLVDSLSGYQRELRQATDPDLLITEANLQKELQRLLDQKAELISTSAPGNAKVAVEKELEKIRSRYETLQAQIKTSARFTEFFRTPPLTLEQIKDQVVDGDTALIEYSLGERRSYLWLVTDAGLKSYELPPKRAIEDSARRLLDLVSMPGDDTVDAAVTELSRLILGPIAGELTGRRLIIVPDGILQYVPFQSLTVSFESYQPLVTHYEIVNAPSASTMAMVTRAARNRQSGPNLIAAFGDPVLPKRSPETEVGLREGNDDNAIASSRSTEPVLNEGFKPNKLTPLFFSRFELNELRKLGRRDRSVIYSDYSATRENLQRLDLTQYRILHFATHGFLDSKQPELSGLVLSMVDSNNQPLTGFVGLADIYQLRAPVDLVVLSACQTALGTEVRGEGLIGLTRGFMYAGASSVVASLWKVDDDATAELMKHFYANMFEKGMTPAAALRAAQNTIREQPHWRSPYYWAAFTLQGNYQQVIRPAESQPRSPSQLIFVLVVVVLMALALLYFYFRWTRGRVERVGTTRR